METTVFRVSPIIIGDIATIVGIIDGFISGIHTDKQSRLSADEKMITYLRTRAPEGSAWLQSKRKIIFSELLHNCGAPFEVAEDFYQEATKRLFEKIQNPNFKVHTSLSAYFIRIAKLTYFEWKRKAKVIEGHKHITKDEYSRNPLINTTNRGSEDQIRLIKKVLERFSPEIKELIISLYSYNLTYEDIVQKQRPDLFNPYQGAEIKKEANRLRGKSKYWMDQLRYEIGVPVNRNETFLLSNLVFLTCLAFANDVSNISGIPVYSHNYRLALKEKWDIDALGIDETTFEWLFSTFTIQELIGILHPILKQHFGQAAIQRTANVLKEYLPIPDDKDKHDLLSRIKFGHGTLHIKEAKFEDIKNLQSYLEWLCPKGFSVKSIHLVIQKPSTPLANKHEAEWNEHEAEWVKYEAEWKKQYKGISTHISAKKKFQYLEVTLTPSPSKSGSFARWRETEKFRVICKRLVDTCNDLRSSTWQ